MVTNDLFDDRKRGSKEKMFYCVTRPDRMGVPFKKYQTTMEGI